MAISAAVGVNDAMCIPSARNNALLQGPGLKLCQTKIWAYLDGSNEYSLIGVANKTNDRPMYYHPGNRG